jgi:hypothetical protein
MAHSGTIIFMRTVPEKEDHRALTKPLSVTTIDGKTEEIPVGFEWDGSSVPWFFQRVFPRHKHPIASCRHDWRCTYTKNATERKWADGEFQKDVGTTSWWITKKIGFLGVRIGAFWTWYMKPAIMKGLDL